MATRFSVGGLPREIVCGDGLQEGVDVAQVGVGGVDARLVPGDQGAAVVGQRRFGGHVEVFGPDQVVLPVLPVVGGECCEVATVFHCGSNTKIASTFARYINTQAA